MTEEQSLIERSRAGSLAAFDDLMQRYERFVYKIAFAYVHDVETAMDITQNVFIKAFSQMGGFRAEGNYRAWIARISCRECIDSLRKFRRMGGAPISLEDLPLASPETGQEEGLIRTQQSRHLKSAIARLNPRQRLAVSLRYFDGASLQEISDILDCDVSLTKNILFRSLEKLRRHLGPLKECF